MSEKSYSFEELCALSGVNSRTVRYYIQIGLLDKPIGQTRGAHYTSLHLEKLLRIKQLSESGISLERIRDILTGDPLQLPQQQKQAGHIEVRTHLWVTDGRRHLAPKNCVTFSKGCYRYMNKLKRTNSDGD